MCHDHDCWTLICQHQKAKNGWLPFWLLYDHYLGAHNVDTLWAHDENKLTMTVYHGQEFYDDVKEAMLVTTPTTLGKEVDI
jgi:hypothetical protein